MASMYEVEKQLESITAQLEVISAMLGITTPETEPVADENA